MTFHDYRVDTLPRHVGRDFGVTRSVAVVPGGLAIQTGLKVVLARF